MKRHLLCHILILFAGTCICQTYNFRNYNEDNGLSQNYIYDISQARNGYLVMSTGEGICTFDGHKFENFSSKELRDKFVNTHLVDSRGIIWLGHSQNGVSYLKNGKTYSLNHEKLSDYKVTDLIEDHQKNIWVATNGAGLFVIDTSFRIQPSAVKFNSPINALCLDYKNRLLAATQEGVKIISAAARDLAGEIRWLKNKNIRHIIPVNKNRNTFWVTAENEGVIGISGEGSSYKEFVHILQPLGSISNQITSIFSDQSENLWVALFGEGLRRVTFTGNIMNKTFAVSSIDKRNGLKDLHIQSLFQDNEGNMWFGTFGGGLIEKPIEKFSFYGVREGLKDVNIKAIAIDTARNIWTGSESGLALIKKESGQYVFYNEKNGFVSDRVNALMIDNRGTLWIGTQNHGVYTYAPGKQRFESFSHRHRLNRMTVNSIVQAYGEVIIGTTEGLYFYDPSENEIRSYTTEEGLLHNNIIHLFPDSRGRLWIASHSSVPYYFEDGKAHSFKNIPGLNSFNINSVCEDKEGNIWIATEGDGVFKYHNEQFVNYTMSNGLLSNYCYGITVDANNSVWVTHKSGLSEKRHFHRDFHSLNKKNGVLYEENNLNAVYRDELHNIWLGTTSGIVHYDSRLGDNTEAPPKLMITRVLMNQVVHSAHEAIVKKYGYYHVHIDFHGISFTDPEGVRYKYRLLGVDSSWKYTNARYVEFPRLSDGDFNFQLMACNAEGLCTQAPLNLNFRINPPIWKTTWFYFLLISFLVASAYMIIHARIRNLKKMQFLLQETVRQKTFLLQREKEEVEKIKIELEHKNKDITDSISYAKRIQDSLLPPQQLMDKLYREKYFVLYKPKDIVSGDFYWSAALKTEDNVYSLAAVFDCTGHGVPGAFLSIVSNDFLKQSISESNVRTPDKILNYLNRTISSNLNQNANAQKVRDGMDIALIAIDYRRLKLFYSGANNPAYIFRTNGGTTSLHILKPTKQAIGHVNENVIPYDLNEFDLLEGDTIYLFSDGYADQFGGEKNKKLTYDRFKQLLEKAYALPIKEQGVFLDKMISEWQGELEQTDDICVMGIRI